MLHLGKGAQLCIHGCLYMGWSFEGYTINWGSTCFQQGKVSECTLRVLLFSVPFCFLTLYNLGLERRRGKGTQTWGDRRRNKEGKKRKKEQKEGRGQEEGRERGKSETGTMRVTAEWRKTIWTNTSSIDIIQGKILGVFTFHVINFCHICILHNKHVWFLPWKKEAKLPHWTVRVK